MANKYHSDIPMDSNEASKPPSPGNRGTAAVAFKSEKTAAWKTSIGKGSKNINKVGWAKVKHSAKTTI